MGVKLFRFVFFLIFIIFLSCRKETVTNWDVDLTGPIVSSKLNIKNFLNDTLFSTDANGLLTLSVNRQVAYVKVDSLIKLPDTTIINQFLWPSPFPSTLTPGQTVAFLPPTPLVFNINNGVALKYGLVRNGTLNIKFSNTVSQPLDFIYVLPGVTKNSVPFSIHETIPPGNNSLIKSYPLDNYSFDLTGGGTANFNTIIQNYTVSMSSSAQPAEVDFGQGAKIEISYSNIVPQYVRGYFGMQSVPVNIDTAKLDIFKNFNATNFQLSDATLDFSLINEFGAEFSGSLYNIKSINTVNQNSVTLNTQQLAAININRAYDVNSQVNPTVKLISLNKTNSNILSFLSNLPDKIAYAGNINLNPLGNTSGYNDFAYYNTGIKVMADISIPLKFTATQFLLQSTTPIDFGTLKQLDNVNYGNFIIAATNGYPFDAILQAYLLDDKNTVVDSLFVPGNNIIPKGTIDAQNNVTSSTSKRLYIPFDTNKLVNIKKSKNMQLKIRLVMPPNPPYISIKDTYEIDIDILLDVNYNVKRK